MASWCWTSRATSGRHSVRTAPRCSIDIATGKAWAAVGMGVASRALAERPKDNPAFSTLAATAQGKFPAATGRGGDQDDTGQVIGGVGASGGNPATG